jgi:hypothetical protein
MPALSGIALILDVAMILRVAAVTGLYCVVGVLDIRWEFERVEIDI